MPTTASMNPTIGSFNAVSPAVPLFRPHISKSPNIGRAKTEKEAIVAVIPRIIQAMSPAASKTAARPSAAAAAVDGSIAPARELAISIIATANPTTGGVRALIAAMPMNISGTSIQATSVIAPKMPKIAT